MLDNMVLGYSRTKDLDEKTVQSGVVVPRKRYLSSFANPPRQQNKYIEKLKELLEDYIKKTKPEYYPPVENLLDLIYEHYTENNPVEKSTVAGKAAKEKEKELEEWLRGLEGMDRLVDDYVGDKIPLWEKIMDRQGTVCCTWEKTAFEEGLKVGIRLMMEVYSL